MINLIQSQGTSRIKLSTAHYDTHSVDRDKMIKACDASEALHWKMHFNTQSPIVLLLHVFSSGHHLSRVVRKPAFCICENKDADQLR